MFPSHKSYNRKIKCVAMLILFNFSLIFGILIANSSVNNSSSANIPLSTVNPPDSGFLWAAGSGSYEGSGVTEVNLTNILNGTSQGDEDGFSISVDGWNSTFVNMTVSNVSLYDYYYILEDDFVNDLTGYGFRYDISSTIWTQGFRLSDRCRLDAVDFVYTTYVNLFNWGSDTPFTGVRIYNATYNALKGNAEPDQLIYHQNESGLEIEPSPLPLPLPPFDWVKDSTASYWNGTLTIKPILNITETYGNWFFISFYSNTSLYWHYYNDGDDVEGDQGITYWWSGEAWRNATTPADCTLRLNVTPLQSEAKPSEINMTISSELVTDEGTWNSTDFLIPEPSGMIPFNITSTWYNIAYDVNWTSYLQNITSAETSFYAVPLDETVLWNVTIPAMFVGDTTNQTLNVTIPTTWNATKVFHDSVEHTDWEEIVGNPEKSVIIRGASDATWIVVCEGNNWISNLSILQDGQYVQELYIFDEVELSAQLIQPVYDEADNAQINVTDALENILDDSLTGRGIGAFINTSWSVAQSIHTNGTYQLVVGWFNGTDAGVWNTSVQVYNSTSIVIVNPEHRGTIIEMAKGQIFNLTLYYNMSYWGGSSWDTYYLNETTGAIVTYTFQGSAPQMMSNSSLDENAWTTEITSPNQYGSYPIYINATAWNNVQNYTNYLITLNVKQYGTTLIFNDTAKDTFWDKPIAFTFTYTNLTGHSIVTENVTIQWKYSSDGSYRGVLQEGLNYSMTYNGGTEEYIIIFDNFSAHTYKLLFTIEGDIYQSQDAYLTLIYNNRTTALTNQTIIPRPVYQEDGVVNVTVYFEDLVDNIGIPGGVIQSNWSSIKNYVIQELGGGYYNVSLNISSVILDNYSILISASKNNYESANLIVQLEIYGYSTNITSVSAANLAGTYAIIYAMENWTVTFEYINVSDGIGIVGATISASLDGESCVWQNGVGGNYTVWADTNKLSPPMAGQNYTLEILIGKPFYEVQRITITINITQLPSQLYPVESMIYAEIDDFIEVRVQLNDTYNHQGISGTIWYELQGDTQEMLPTGTEGLYYAIVNLTDYLPGEYQINIDSYAIDFQNASETITLNVSRLNVFIITESETFSGYVNELLNIRIQLKDSKNRIVEGLDVSYAITPGPIPGTLMYNENGYYNASINMTGVGSYQIRINTSLTLKYNESISIFNIEVKKIPTIIIPADANITAYYGEEYLLSVTFLDTLHSSLINNENLQYEITGEIPLAALTWVGSGNYQTTLNLTEIGIGDYIIEVTTGTLSAVYQDANVSIELHIQSRIQTELNIYMPVKVGAGEILNTLLELQTNNSVSIPDELISYSIKIYFHNGASSEIQQTLFTNTSGMGLIQYLVPKGANIIDLIAYYAGSINYTAIWNSSNIVVSRINYSLTIQVPSQIQVEQNLLIRASLSNGTHPIGNALINFTITVVFSNYNTRIVNLSDYTDGNGAASVTFTVPTGAISLYIVAFYRGEEGMLTTSDPQVVISMDPLMLWLSLWGWLLALIIMIVIMVILLLALYYRYLRPKFRSVEEKKQILVQKRAENRREIATLTHEIQNIRSETLKEADLAKRNIEFNKAAKLYDKAGNLTLELADKSVAREFFLQAKEMEKFANQKTRQKDLKEQREKLLEKAREAIRARDIVEASRNYRQVAEISRMLGEREQAAKFLKLADAAHERIEALKEGDLRKKSGIYLSKADKAMGKQNFVEAAENFEEAAKIMLYLGDDEAIKRFTGWAKLAREREALAKKVGKDVWENEIIENQKQLIRKANGLIREKHFEEAADIYGLLTIQALELGNLASIKKFKKDIEFCRKQASIEEISPEIRGLMSEREKLLANVAEAVKNNRYSVAARYYKRIATISEAIDGKEVARTYTKQANYYLSKVKEKILAEEVKPIEPTIEEKPVKPIEKVAVDELEETKAQLAQTVKNARNALKTGKTILARELYEKSSHLAAMIDDKESELRYSQKAEEIEILKPQKRITNEAEIRKKISDLMQKAETALRKKKNYSDAKNYYEEISELFIQLGDEEAANEFLERANSVSRLIK